MRKIISAISTVAFVLILAGCPRSPQLNLGPPQAVKIPDRAGVIHPYCFVAIKSGNSILDHSVGFSLFDEDGKHVLTNTYNNNGVLETLGGPFLQTLTPAVNAWEVLK